MGVYKPSVITNGGNGLIAQAVAGTDKIIFTAVKTSSYAYPDGTNIADLTDLQDIQQSVGPSSAEVFNQTMIQIGATFENSQVDADYLIQTIGVYAKLGDEGTETLFAVVQATTPDQMPEQSDISPSSFIYYIQMTVQQASSISITVDPSGTASVADVEALKAQVNRILTLVEVELPASGWSPSYPYTQSAAVQGFEDKDTPAMSMAIDQTSTADEVKAYKKAYGYIYYGEVTGGNAVFYATQKPEIDIKVMLSGPVIPGTQLTSETGDIDLSNYVQVTT